MRIILTGAQGTGKTTLMNALAKEGVKTISHIRKTAEANGIDMTNATAKGQQLLFNTLKDELSNNDNYISDRGLTCVAAYTFDKVLSGEIEKPVADQQYIETSIFAHENPDIIFVYVPIEFEIEDDGVRTTDAYQQSKIDFFIKNMLDTMDIPYIKVTGSVEQRVAQVEAVINNN